MRVNSVARRYAQATFDVARSKGRPEEWLIHLQAIGDAVGDRDLAQALRSPNIPDDKKIGAIESMFPGIPQELKNLVSLLVRRGRIDILPGICAAFSTYLDELAGRIEASVVSARSLQPDELDAIKHHLNRRTGRSVNLRTFIDQSLIGGVVMRVGDEVIDASVATRLDRLRQRLA